jgi:hypothetical protein
MILSFRFKFTGGIPHSSISWLYKAQIVHGAGYVSTYGVTRLTRANIKVIIIRPRTWSHVIPMPNLKYVTLLFST